MTRTAQRTQGDGVAIVRVPGLLRTNRDFRLLWFGESVSELGSTVTYVALPFVALTVLHATTFQVAALSAAETICWPFIALPVGVWVDRVSRRKILLITDGGRAVALGSIPVAAAFGVLTLLQLYIVGVVAGVLTIFFSVAYPSYLPSVVDTPDLVDGNALLSGTQGAAQVVGPALGGTLVQAFGAAYALVADAVSFIVSAAALRAIASAEPPPTVGRHSMRHEIAEGVRFLLHHRVLRAFIVATAVSNLFAGGAQAIYVVFLVRVIHVRPGVVGLLLSLGALGGVLGAMLAGRIVARIGAGRAVVLAASLEAVGAYLVPAAGGGARIALFCVGIGVANAAIVVFNVVVGSYRQQVVPARIMGRAVAANRMVTWGVLPVGAFAAGAFAAGVGLRETLWLFAVGITVAPISLVLAGLTGVRDLPRDDMPFAAGAQPVLGPGTVQNKPLRTPSRWRKSNSEPAPVRVEEKEP